ncbi:hypothetical protein [Amycolatopsis cihanbeyliensis]|uniref:Uncharacterized protein n=1 Tax=Amycolatopsis cihanbeyliensis TaxID=1128664 RepID=A0A542DE26_AMYCI|nr:hypothetical protein [Amycolatopsis cihanbeyliensis]TQJ01319.1 hypothetical protein FB471_0993 [Amycolatopsis cihanbeyliensis]
MDGRESARASWEARRSASSRDVGELAERGIQRYLLAQRYHDDSGESTPDEEADAGGQDTPTDAREEA